MVFCSTAFFVGLKGRAGGEGPWPSSAPRPAGRENAYRRDLWLLKEGETPPAPYRGRQGGRLPVGGCPHPALHRGPGRGEKREREAGEDYTAFYRLDTRGGDEAVKAFSVPLSAVPVAALGRGRTLLSVDWDLRFSKGLCPKGRRQGGPAGGEEGGEGLPGPGRAALLRQWGAGTGTKSAPPCSSLRRGTGPARPPHPGNLRHRLRPPQPRRGQKLLYTGESFTGARKHREGIFLYDLAGKRTTTLLPARIYQVYDALWWVGKGACSWAPTASATA